MDSRVKEGGRSGSNGGNDSGNDSGCGGGGGGNTDRIKESKGEIANTGPWEGPNSNSSFRY